MNNATPTAAAISALIPGSIVVSDNRGGDRIRLGDRYLGRVSHHNGVEKLSAAGVHRTNVRGLPNTMSVSEMAAEMAR